MDWQVRTRLLIGANGINKLSRSRVAVFGLGGVGSYAAEALARSGIGTMLMVDFDTVAPSNINRQLHALTSTVGRLKVELMAERIRLINPQVILECKAEKFVVGSGPDLLDPAPDFVLDAIDDVKAKVDLLVYCVGRNIPVISSMGAGNKLNPGGFQVADISVTTVCPLARAVRRQLRHQGITSGVPVIFSTEQPAKTGYLNQGSDVEVTLDGGNRPLPGSIAFVPPAVGLLMAGYIVNRLLAKQV